jgi:hypothetical protein
MGGRRRCGRPRHDARVARGPALLQFAVGPLAEAPLGAVSDMDLNVGV